MKNCKIIQTTSQLKQFSVTDKHYYTESIGRFVRKIYFVHILNFETKNSQNLDSSEKVDNMMAYKFRARVALPHYQVYKNVTWGDAMVGYSTQLKIVQQWELGKKCDGKFIFTFAVVKVRYGGITMTKIFKH